MGPHQKRLLREWENDAAASHSQREVKNSNTGELKDKKVCQYCKREFSCGRGLGGHIKVHFRNRRKTKFTHRKLSRKRDIQSSAPLHTRKISYSRKDKDKQDGGSDVLIDLSKSISGCGWKGHRKRGCNEREIIATADQDSDGDGDDDDGDSILMEMLKRSGFSGSAHQISRIRRYVCNTCNVVLPTFHAVRCHVNDSDSSPNNDDDDDHEEEVDDEDYEEEEEEDEDEEEYMGTEEDDDNDNEEEEEEDEDEDDDEEDDDDDNDDDEDDDEEEEEVEDDDDEEEEEVEEEVGVEASMEIDEVAEEDDDDDDDGDDDDEEDDDEEEEEVEDEVGAEAFMEVDEIADEEEQEEVGAEAASMEVADVEEEQKAAKASTEVDKVADEEEEGVDAKTSTQVDEVAEACDNSGSMDQKVSTSNPPKKLDFDLNEMPPEED